MCAPNYYICVYISAHQSADLMTMGMPPPRHCLASVCVVAWRAEMDGLIPIYERHPPIGHTPIGRIRDVPIGYQSDWLGPLLKGPAQARFWGRRPEAAETTRPGRRPGTRETTRPPEPPPWTSSPLSPVALGAAPDHPHHHISTNISTRSSVKPH